MSLTPAIESAGYGITGDIGGLPRTTYYTPDGRIIKAIPDMREYVKKQDGKVVGQGKRDANLDKGWLLSPPVVPKLFCSTCDRWHDTQAEIRACGRAQKGLVKRALANANREKQDRTSDLERQIAELTAKLNKLMEDKHGALLQPASHTPEPVSRKQGFGKATAAV